jgi:hypothetical protein
MLFRFLLQRYNGKKRFPKICLLFLYTKERCFSGAHGEIPKITHSPRYISTQARVPMLMHFFIVWGSFDEFFTKTAFLRG